MEPSKTIYRVTGNPGLLQASLRVAEHLFVKNDDGSFYCDVHKTDADQCAERIGDVVWHSRLDHGTFVATVVRTKPYLGRLTLTRDDEVVLDRAVRLMYDAPFGPDFEDVQRWQTICQAAADSDYCNRGLTPPA